MPRSERWIVISLLLVSVCVLATAAWLRPDPRGYGTHRQLLLPSCDFLADTGYPCASCGLTTSFAHMMRGQIGRAGRAQPFGVVLFLGVVGHAAWLAWCWVGGRSYLEWLERSWKRWAALGLVTALAGWAYKVVTTV